MRLARLVTRSLARHRGLLAGMAVVLAGFQVLLVTIAVNLQREGLFGMMSAIIPPAFQASLGGAGLATFGGFVAFGFFHPVVILALAAATAYLAAELAGDVESGLVDLVAARPVSRVTLVVRSALTAAVATLGVVASMVLANRAAALVLSGQPGAMPLPPLVKLAANLVALTWCCGAIGLAIAAASRRRAAATGASAILFIALYLVNFAAPWWRPARPFARLAPFHYYDALAVFTSTHAPARDIAVLLAVTAVCLAAACVLYHRRDL